MEAEQAMSITDELRAHHKGRACSGLAFTGLCFRCRAAARIERLEKALRALLEMSESEAGDFNHHLEWEECMEAAQHQARLALSRGGEEGK